MGHPRKGQAHNVTEEFSMDLLSANTNGGKRAARLDKVARAALHNARRGAGARGSLGLKAGASFVSLASGETAVVLERISGPWPVIVAVSPTVTYRSRVLEGREYAEALSEFREGALVNFLRRAVATKGEDAVLDTLIRVVQTHREAVAAE
jgi:hypothetical protein